MDERKIAFIICVNDELYERECVSYIERLKLPEGFVRDIVLVREAGSITTGYNGAMRESDAKYKVYLHQDVFIVYPDFIAEILKIFENPAIGMIGMVGAPVLGETAVMWHGDRVGKLYTNPIALAQEVVCGEIEGTYCQVEVIDGFLMATQYDVMWREDLFQKWDFYDVSQSLEFQRQGYQVVVPNMERAWCIHDDGIWNLSNYYEEREIFLKEYRTKKKFKEEEDKCIVN